MSTEQVDNTNDGTTEESLEDFAAELFGGKTEAPDNAKSEETDEDDAEVNGESDTDTVDTQTDDLEEEDVSEDDDTLAQDEDEDTDEGEEESSSKPKKKNRFQERIDELTAARKEAERKVEEQAADFQKQLDEMREKLEGNKDKSTEETSESGPVLKAPKKDDLDENGKPKYPLGEYDPKFMRDTVEHMFAEREAKAEEEKKLTAEEQQQQQARAELQQNWNTKLVDARERYPDFQEKGEQMLSVFEGIDKQYGDYLTTTIQEMDNGPDVFYYLANNVEEAQKIVAAGPKRATMELAKIEASLSNGTPSKPTKRVSRAKAPPPQNKGSAIAKPKVAPDTDDLGAFEKELFRKS